jgi:hypothetical protein
MDTDLFRRPLICRTSQSRFPRCRPYPALVVLFPSEYTDFAGIAPGLPPRRLVMGVFPWKLNRFLSHLLATANTLSAQIRDRGLHNRSPLPRGVLNYGKLITAHNYGSGIGGSDQDDIPDEDENVSRRKKRAKADDEAHDDAADDDEDGDEDDDDDAGDDGDDDGDDGCGN